MESGKSTKKTSENYNFLTLSLSGIFFNVSSILLCIYVCLLFFLFQMQHNKSDFYKRLFLRWGGYAAQLKGCGILVPWSGIKPAPVAVKVQSPNHCTAREFLKRRQLLYTQVWKQKTKFPLDTWLYI